MKKFFQNNWHRIFLLFTMLLGGFLTFYKIGNEGYSNNYYAAAIRSMLKNWHNFFFASFDPGGFVTVDKPALGLWLQAISAKIFGFHGYSLILPEALSLIFSIFLIYTIVKRFFGKMAGLIAALVLSITPIFVAVSRTNNLDASLICVLLLATLALIVAAEKGKLWYLILSFIFVGLGFNIKMLQAFMVLPAFYLVYLLVSPVKISKRVIHLAITTVVLLAFSLSWALIVDFTDKSERPYIGSSQTNSVIELALGYNGLQRLLGHSFGNTFDGQTRINMSFPTNSTNNNQADQEFIPQENLSQNGAISQDNSITIQNQPNPPSMQNQGNPSMRMDNQDGFGRAFSGGAGGVGGVGENGQKGLFRIFNQQLAGQISWFIPLALFGLLILFLSLKTDDKERRRILLLNILLWGTWLFVMTGFFSVAGFYHRYYLSMLSPSIAALVGIGLIKMWKAYLKSGWQFILLPLAILVNGFIQVLILSRYSTWKDILIPIVIVSSILSALGLIIIRLLKKDYLQKTIKGLIALAMVAMMVSPLLWSYTPILYGSQSTLPIAGPELNGDNPSGMIGMGFGTRPSFMRNSEQDNSNSELINFLLKNKNNEKYILATTDANTAAPIIIKTGEAVMAIGGFSGSDNILTLNKFKSMIEKGEIRFFLVSQRGGGRQSEILNWVMQNGKEVSYSSDGLSGFGMGGTLYDLAPEKGTK